MAAGLALAATVVIEVVRHDRDPREVVTAPRAEEKQESSEIFQLSPLPTATADEEDIPVGAADRLLARPPAEPRLDEPEPLDVRGPLSTDEISAQKEKGRAQAPRSAAAPKAESFSATDAAERDKARAAEAAPAHASAAPAGEKTAAGKQASRHAVVRVALVAKDGTAVAEVDLPGPPPPAGTVVTIAAGVIVAESPADLGRDQSDGAIRWLGLAVAGVPDGQYRIEPPAQREVRPVQ
jgi:hypothetical protein